MTRREEKLRRLEHVAQHLDIAIGEFASITGAAYVGDLREFKRLVQVRLKLETILRRARAGLEWERKRVSKGVSHE